MNRRIGFIAASALCLAACVVAPTRTVSFPDLEIACRSEEAAIIVPEHPPDSERELEVALFADGNENGEPDPGEPARIHRFRFTGRAQVRTGFGEVPREHLVIRCRLSDGDAVVERTVRVESPSVKFRPPIVSRSSFRRGACRSPSQLAWRSSSR